MNKEAAEATEAELAQQARHAAVTAELDAMRLSFHALRNLDDQAKSRVMRWLDSAIYNRQEPPF